MSADGFPPPSSRRTARRTDLTQPGCTHGALTDAPEALTKKTPICQTEESRSDGSAHVGQSGEVIVHTEGFSFVSVLSAETAALLYRLEEYSGLVRDRMALMFIPRTSPISMPRIAFRR